MRFVLGVALVCFVSSLVYCAGPDEGENPRAEEIKANFDKLVSEVKEVKREALLYFGKVDKTFAAEVPLFTASLKDERNQVRAISAYALGKIGKAAAGSIAEVEKLLTDSSATVQKYAKRALERLRPFRPVPKKPISEGTAPAQKPGAIKPTPPEVIDAIKKLGGGVHVDENKSIVALSFYKANANPALMAHLKGLTQLEDLRLAATKVTDAGLVHLKGLVNLQHLSLQFNSGVTDAGLAHLKRLTKLEYLGLDDTMVTDAGLEHLKGLTNLEILLLNDTQVTDAGLVYLKGLIRLKALVLPSSPKVTDAGLAHLKGLTKLETLLLSYAKITDAGLEHLKGLTKLKKLLLRGTDVTDAGVMKLKQELPNCQILYSGIGH